MSLLHCRIKRWWWWWWIMSNYDELCWLCPGIPTTYRWKTRRIWFASQTQCLLTWRPCCLAVDWPPTLPFSESNRSYWTNSRTRQVRCRCGTPSSLL